MGITPMEINNKEFKRSFRGYDIDEVDDFLEQIVEDYEKLYKENAALREKLNSISEKLEHYTKIEATLQNTLVLAQGAADQAKSNSQKESELIVKNANDTAQRIIDQAHSQVIRITGEYERVKQEFQLFKSRYKTFIQTQLDLLSDIDTLTTDGRSNSSIDSSGRGFEKPIKTVELKTDSETMLSINDSDNDSIEEVPVAAAKEGFDFRTKTIDFASKTSELSANFDDFDDDKY